MAPKPPSSPKKARRPILAILLALIVFALTATVLWWLLPAQPRLTLATGKETTFAGFSPDGKLIATVTEPERESSRGPIRLWDIERKQERLSLAADWPSLNQMVFSPDSKVVVTLASEPIAVRREGRSTDSSAALWDVATGYQRASFETQMPPVFSPDSQTLAVVAPGHDLQLWDIRTGSRRTTIPGAGHFAFALDGQTIAVAEDASADSRPWQQSLAACLALVGNPCLAAPLRRLAEPDQVIRLRDVTTGEPRITLPGLVHSVVTMAFSPDSRRLAVGKNSSAFVSKPSAEVMLWDVASGKGMSSISLNSPSLRVIEKLQFSANGQALIANPDGSAVLWDLRASSPKLLDQQVASTLAADGNQLAVTRTEDGEIRVLEVPSLRERSRFEVGKALFQLGPEAFTPDGRTLVVVVSYFAENQDFLRTLRRDLRHWLPGKSRGEEKQVDTELKFLDAESGHEVGVLTDLPHGFPFGRGAAQALFASDSKTLALPGPETIQLWDVPPRAPWLTILGLAVTPSLLISLLCFPRLKWIPIILLLAAVGGGVCFGAYQLWGTGDRDAKTQLAKPRPENIPTVNVTPDESVNSLMFSGNGKLLAAAGVRRGEHPIGIVSVWDVATGNTLAQFTDQSGWGSACVALDPEGNTLAAWTAQGDVQVWELSAKKVRATLRGFPPNSVPGLFSGVGPTLSALVFSPDGKQLASGSTDGTLKLWDIVTGKEKVSRLDAHSDVNMLRFSPDGKVLASASNVVKLWDAESLKEKATLPAEFVYLRFLEFTPDGKTLGYGGPTPNAQNLKARLPMPQSPEEWTLKRWDVAASKMLADYALPSSDLHAAHFITAQRMLLAVPANLADGGGGGMGNEVAMRAKIGMELKLWDLATGTLRTAESKIAGTVGRVQFSKDGKLLAFEFPSRDGSTEMVGLWDVTVENGQPVWRERRQFVFKEH